jgi:hypothetical protein
MVCRHLRHEFKDRLFHILRSEELESHDALEERLLAGVGIDDAQDDLFQMDAGESAIVQRSAPWLTNVKSPPTGKRIINRQLVSGAGVNNAVPPGSMVVAGFWLRIFRHTCLRCINAKEVTQ